jgi:diadenosine tetraphosphate (Ap4A) HIT family hydrolase
MKGWFVVVLLRHDEALHELIPEEYIEFTDIQQKLINLIHKELKCEKEYVSCYAEKENYRHIHFHIFTKPNVFPIEMRGAKSFAIIKATESEAVPKEEITEFCNKFHSLYQNL